MPAYLLSREENSDEGIQSCGTSSNGARIRCTVGSGSSQRWFSTSFPCRSKARGGRREVKPKILYTTLLLMVHACLAALFGFLERRAHCVGSDADPLRKPTLW